MWCMCVEILFEEKNSQLYYRRVHSGTTAIYLVADGFFENKSSIGIIKKPRNKSIIQKNK